MNTLEEAVGKVKERAHNNCDACGEERYFIANGEHLLTGDLAHTCEGDLAAVRDALLTVAQRAGRHLLWRDVGGKAIPCKGCDLCNVEAEIDRLLPGEGA